ncbi:helicase-related protein [Nannocystis pusilla]|uniref:helicase-related protein n=1 Tax=Nannocystis pusilla TaxID=889268 RepID=UPI003B7C2D75
MTLHLGRPTYESPKLTECAKRVAASPHCGHIIFCEPTAVHLWMREVLVKHGIPRERIAILNAEETSTAERVTIARDFNGLSSEPPAPGTCARPSDSAIAPKYDVVIANSVAYEGIDLQVRTCTIHHLDLPWTPADLEQRNGRAVRQGNTLGTVQIFYYFADGSTDGYRFSLIDGKAGWLGELIKSQVRDTNNPAAQQQLTPEDILLMISRNKDKTRALLEDKRKRQTEEARSRIAKEAARVLRQAAGRFRDARLTTDTERAARLRDEGEQRLADLEQVSPDAWPWAPWMYAVRDVDMIVPENGGAPVYEGLRVTRPRPGAPDQLDHLEFGQIVASDEGERIGLRAAGSPSWQLITYAGTLGGAPITSGELPRDGGPMWPDDDEARTGKAIEDKLGTVFRHGKFEALGWRGASEAWLEKWWPRFEAAIAEGLAGSFHREKCRWSTPRAWPSPRAPSSAAPRCSRRRALGGSDSLSSRPRAGELHHPQGHRLVLVGPQGAPGPPVQRAQPAAPVDRPAAARGLHLQERPRELRRAERPRRARRGARPGHQSAPERRPPGARRAGAALCPGRGVPPLAPRAVLRGHLHPEREASR